MMNYLKNKKILILLVGLLFVVVSLGEPTYSLFLQNNETTDMKYSTGILQIEIDEDSTLSLDNVFPVLDSEGVEGTPYTLKVTNTGSLTYMFDLSMISDEDNSTIDSKYLKVKVNDKDAFTLASVDGMISENNIIYPGEEITFNIRIWLDKDTPNSEIGKSFTARFRTSGEAIYKTVDESGANYPMMDEGMIAVNYDDVSSTWRIADVSNMDSSNMWYNYGLQKWANVVTIKDSEKYIYDVLRGNDIRVDNVSYNNGNFYGESGALDIGISNYQGNSFSSFLNVKISSDNEDYVYLLSNDLVKFFYDFNSSQFKVMIGDNVVNSNRYDITDDKFYTVGFSGDGYNVYIYVNGNVIGSGVISENVGGSSFKLGSDSEEHGDIIVSSIYLYDRVLSNDEIVNNFGVDVNYITDGLIEGYNKFVPQTKLEYYLSLDLGGYVKSDDIMMSYVWIPRYKYQVFNIMGEVNANLIDTYNTGIDVVFESNTNSTGIINCDSLLCYQDSLGTVVTSSDNGKYLTHPAFGDDLRGFWVSKYSVVNSETAIDNLEWGAISYLMYSKYGVCSDGCSVDDSLDSTTNNMYGVIGMNHDKEVVSENSQVIGSATKEIMISENMLWNNEIVNTTNQEGSLFRGYNSIFGYQYDLVDEDLQTRLVIK